MPRRAVYHLDLDDEKIQEARFALLPGDPFRLADRPKAVELLITTELPL